MVPNNTGMSGASVASGMSCRLKCARPVPEKAVAAILDEGKRPGIHRAVTMEVDEITVPSPDVPGGLTFGPVTLETVWEDPVDLSNELLVTMMP